LDNIVEYYPLVVVYIMLGLDSQPDIDFRPLNYNAFRHFVKCSNILSNFYISYEYLRGKCYVFPDRIVWLLIIGLWFCILMIIYCSFLVVIPS